MSGEDNLVERFFDFLSSEKYRMQISAMPMVGSVRVSFSDLIAFDIELAEEVTNNFREAMRAMKRAAKRVLDIVRPVESGEIGEDKIYIEIVGDAVGHELKLREVSSEYIWKLVTVSGLLVKVSQTYSVPMRIVLEYDGVKRSIERESPTDPMPRYIEMSDRRVPVSACKVVDGESEFIDIQYARIQEPPDEIPPGEIPSFIDVVLTRPLIGRVTPGDRVRVSGCLEIVRTRDRRDEKYEFRLLANSIRSEKKTDVEIDISGEDIEEIISEARRDGFYKKVLRSIAPSIYGHEIIKEAVLLSLIGGVDKVLPDGTRRRGRIHVLLVGDPGVAKSQLLKYAARIAPKGIYTSGRGSTAAGLTAAVVKDPGGGLSLEAGAVALADMGICAIDEIDKMRPEDRVALHEAMEQMTISISKGGIIATLNARTTIIAAANPVDGVYNPLKPVLKNIDMPVTLVSRFDLIHLMRDEPGNIERDSRLVDHIISSLSPDSKIYEDTYGEDFLRKYIAYARMIRPKFSKEAWDEIKGFFIKIRASVNADSDDIMNKLPITPRELEAMIRLAEASARAHLRDMVTIEDAKIAIAQMMASMSVAALDTTTGEIDAAIIATGVPSRKASLDSIIIDTINEVAKDRECAHVDEVVATVKKITRVSEDKIRKAIGRLHSRGYVIEAKMNCFKVAVKDHFL